MAKRQTISFSDDVLQIIEAYRKKQERIPSFNDAVLAILRDKA